MLFERIESQGLAHYSYLVGDRHEALVLDPRRDCDVYVNLAARQGYRITTILETHRNEDYAIGSVELAARTGAEIGHADGQLPYRYGQPVSDGQSWRVGRLEVKAIHSPGHTPGSMSYLLHESGGAPWILFTGDALFAGDAGRVDLLGRDRIDEMAGLLYETLYHRLLPLGDPIIVCPAHGPGSVCGASIADRTWTTLGLERRVNPKLQFAGRDAFVAHVAQPLEAPPYFARMEQWNVEGAPPLGLLPAPRPLLPYEIDDRLRGADAVLLDTRNELSFAAGHVPGALSIWQAGVPSFAGWFLPYDTPILLVNDTDDAGDVVRMLARLGYDRIEGCLAGGMTAWHEAGLDSRSLRTITVTELCRHIEQHECIGLLDVRSDHELDSDGRVPGALHIHVTQLPGRIDEVPRDRPVYIFCASGLRSTTAAALLQRGGWDNVAVVLGGFSAWAAAGCPIDVPQ